MVPVDLVHFVCQEESIHSHREPQRRVLEENGMLGVCSQGWQIWWGIWPNLATLPLGLPDWKGNLAQSGNTAKGQSDSRYLVLFTLCFTVCQ